MKRVSLDEAGKTLNTYFESAKQSVFKVEVLQDYSAIDEGRSLQAWRRGEKEKAVEYAREDSQKWVEKMKALPVKVKRFHIIEIPLTTYLEWEVATYKNFVEQGSEDVNLVRKDKLPQLDIPDGDFWIVDDEKVVKFNYQGPKGKAVDGFVYDENDDISNFLRVRDELLKVAKPV